MKPTAPVEDAIKDCSKRGNIVLDCFAGSGTTALAAERCGRRARLIECDPGYCDVAIARFEAATGKAPLLEATGELFADVERRRLDTLGGAAA